jgi:hypothetical protein
MAKSTLYELALDLTLNSAKLETGIDKANSKLNEFELNTKNIGSMITKTLSFAGIGVGVAGLLKTIKTSIESVEGPGDRFAAKMAGGKEALSEFQRALGNMNFSGLINNLIEGYNRGKEFNKLLDELSDRKSFNDYRIAQLEREANALRETSKNKQLDIKVRADVAEQIKVIEEKIFKRKEVLINREYDITKGNWEDTYKMTVEQATAVYEFTESLSTEKGKRLAEAFAGSYENQFHDMKKTIQSIMFGQYDPTLMKEFSKKDLETYSLYFKANEGGKADPWKTLFELRGKYEGNLTEAQVNYNGAIRETSAILNNEEKDTKKEADAKEKELKTTKELNTEIAKAIRLKGSVTQRSDYNATTTTYDKPGAVTMPTFSNPSNISNAIDKLAPRPVTQKVDALTLAITKLSETSKLFSGWDDAFGFVASSLENLTGTLETGADSFKEYGKSIKSAIKDIIGSFIAKGVAVLVSSALETAALTGPGAIILAPILTAVAAGVARTAFNSLIPGFATGTNFAPGGWAMVGEKGPEPMYVPRGSTILPHGQTPNMLAPSSVLIKFQDGSLQGYMDYQSRKINASK